MTRLLKENINEFGGEKDHDYFFEKDHELRGKISLELLREVFNKRKHADSPKLLSIACSTGVIEEKIKKQTDIAVYGIDAAHDSLKTAKSRDILAVCTDASSQLPFENDSFDFVFAGEIIEHIFDTRFFLGEINRVLKTDRYLIITTPNLARLDDRFKLLLGKTPRQTSPLHPYLNMHIRPFTYDSLKNALRATGFSDFTLRSNAFILDLFGKEIKLYSDFFNKHFPTLGSTLIVRSKKTS